jgi:hypothetical protein
MNKLLLCLLLITSTAQAATIPVAASDVAQSWDGIYWFLVYLSLVFFVLPPRSPQNTWHFTSAERTLS